MTGANQGKKFRGCIWIVILLLLITSGCAALSKDEKSSSEAAATTTATEAEKNKPVYYEFDDVLVPSELKIDQGDSFVYQTAGFTVGLLALKGRVDFGSLIEFFEKNMRKDNWRLISEFKSQRAMMLFQKENRWCVIGITEGTYKTHVKIWVAPTTAESAGGLLK